MDGGGKKEGKCSYHDLSGSLACQNWPNKENLPKEGGITGDMHHNIINLILCSKNFIYVQCYIRGPSRCHLRSDNSAAIPDPFGQNFGLKMFTVKQYQQYHTPLLSKI